MHPIRHLIVLISFTLTARAQLVAFDISPRGTTPGVGLHPANEVIPALSVGTGNELGQGVFVDLPTRTLFFDFGYGSAYGFNDLTGPAFSWLVHGPSPLDETAAVLFDLRPFHSFAQDPARGGRIAGSLPLTPEHEALLLGGLGYINIYTPGNMGGELRGQLIVVPEPTGTALLTVGCFLLVVFSRRLPQATGGR